MTERAPRVACPSAAAAARTAAAALAALAGLGAAGCAVQATRTTFAPPPVIIQPLEVTTTYIAARVPRSARGEVAIVEVCVMPDGAVAATRIAQSSTDKAFDAAALDFARQARYRPQTENGRPVYACEQVRVEVNPNPGPRIGGGADSALG
jgi:TonB family protein